MSNVVVIAHRGASGDRPEHTIESYRLAIEEGADYIEPDLVMTRDGVLVARHENEIGGTTDVAQHPEFAARRRRQVIDGETMDGWFTEDFTLAELKTLRARERIPAIRPANARFDGQYQIPTLLEIVELVRDARARTGRAIGIYPETKHPRYFRTIGLPLEPMLLELLGRYQWSQPDAPVLVQSFDEESLRILHARSGLRCMQLLRAQDGPRLSTNVLAAIATYADGIVADKSLVLPVQDGALAAPTTLVARAHLAGLLVHIYTLRPENTFLPAALRLPPADDPALRGDGLAEMQAFLAAGVDGFFTDDPALGRQAVKATASKRS